MLDEVTDTAPAELLAVKLLAEYSEAKLLDQSVDGVLAELGKQLQDQGTHSLALSHTYAQAVEPD